MKAILIVYNQALTEKVESLLNKSGIKGFTLFPSVMGRGSAEGEPRMGTHTWPEMNSATLTMVNDDLVDAVLERVKKLDEVNHEVGIRAFVWEVEKSI
ncbi:MAG TPA: P-II family nitrogen regulator [Bacteroidales bacterium]|nr:P-II family nitrogen regulator [Bacteroidales bacterium]